MVKPRYGHSSHILKCWKITIRSQKCLFKAGVKDGNTVLTETEWPHGTAEAAWRSFLWTVWRLEMPHTASPCACHLYCHTPLSTRRWEDNNRKPAWSSASYLTQRSILNQIRDFNISQEEAESLMLRWQLSRCRVGLCVFKDLVSTHCRHVNLLLCYCQTGCQRRRVWMHSSMFFSAYSVTASFNPV